MSDDAPGQLIWPAPPHWPSPPPAEPRAPTDDGPYRVVFTDAAQAVAEALASLDAVEAYARQQVMRVQGAGFERLWKNIVFHAFPFPTPDSEQEFCIRPLDEESMVIDMVASWESLREHDTGGLLPLGEFAILRRASK